MSPTGKNLRDNQQTHFLSTSDQVGPSHTNAGTRPLVHACRGRPELHVGVPLCFSTTPLFHVSRQSHECNASIPCTLLYSLSPYFHAAIATSQNIQHSPGAVSAYSSNQSLHLPSLSCMYTKTLFFLQCKTKMTLLPKLLMRTDKAKAQSAQKENRKAKNLSENDVPKQVSLEKVWNCSTRSSYLYPSVRSALP